MKKQKKQLIALCILLLICIVAWVSLTKWNKSQEQKKQEEEEASKVMVTDISTEDVKAFSYQYNNETLSFVKEDDTWYYEADKSIALDQDAVETLVTTAAQFTADQEIRDYEDLSEYGLETPSNTITLTTGDGTTTLLIGNKNDMLSNRNCGIKGLTSKISIGKIYEKVWKRNSNHWKPSERKRQVRVFDGR